MDVGRPPHQLAHAGDEDPRERARALILRARPNHALLRVAGSRTSRASTSSVFSIGRAPTAGGELLRRPQQVRGFSPSLPVLGAKITLGSSCHLGFTDLQSQGRVVRKGLTTSLGVIGVCVGGGA